MSTTIEPTVYEADSRSLPRLGAYLGRVYAQRGLIWAIAQSNIKAGHLDTWFGRVWTVLNPFLLGLTYFFLIGVILGQDITMQYLALLLGGLFAFYFTRSAVASGATAIVKGGAMVRATAVPRMVLPLASVAVALRTYVPTLLVYAVLHVIGGMPIGASLALVPLLIAIQAVANTGLAFFFSTATVYFRDTASFLPYLLRIWMYLTPVLYMYDSVPARAQRIMEFNPLYRLFTAWQKAVFQGIFPSAWDLSIAALWAIGLLVLGGYAFLTREKDFAIRI